VSESDENISLYKRVSLKSCTVVSHSRPLMKRVRYDHRIKLWRYSFINVYNIIAHILSYNFIIISYAFLCTRYLESSSQSHYSADDDDILQYIIQL